MRLPLAIRGLFKRGDEFGLLLQAAGAATPRPGPPPTRAEKARLKHFESRLRSLAQAGGSDAPLVAGRLQIIALSRVKERLGQDWARLATRVHRLTRRILERRLTDEDVYVQVGDCYMILFARLTSVEATFKAQTIAREITALLIGDLPEVDEAPIQITIHEIDPGELRARPTLETLAARMDDDAREAGTTDGGGPDHAPVRRTRPGAVRLPADLEPARPGDRRLSRHLPAGRRGPRQRPLRSRLPGAALGVGRLAGHGASWPCGSGGGASPLGDPGAAAAPAGLSGALPARAPSSQPAARLCNLRRGRRRLVRSDPRSPVSPEAVRTLHLRLRPARSGADPQPRRDRRRRARLSKRCPKARSTTRSGNGP